MLMAKSTQPGNPAYLLDAPPRFWEAERLQGVKSYKRWRFATSAGSGKGVSTSAIMSSSRLRLCKAGPLMNMESQNKCMRFRSMSLTQWWVLLALLSATGSPAPSFSQGTLEQRLACTPDVLRLCSTFIPNADEITICLGEKKTELSDACRTAFEAGMKQPPNAGDSTQSRKRTAK